jgi:hypothetical protein
LVLFIAYVGAMGFLSVYGFIHGDLTKLLAPIDGKGNFCGIKNGADKDTDLTGYPYLYFGDLSITSITNVAEGNLLAIFERGVCVSSCPKALSSGVIKC